jgi:hypothetical protein
VVVLITQRSQAQILPSLINMRGQMPLPIDGAMVSGYLGDPSAVGDALYNAGRAIIAVSSA